MDIYWNVSVDSLKDVVALLERTAGDGAGAHRNYVFGLGHLVVKPHDLWRHFLGDCARDNHQVSLARRRPKNFSAKAGEVKASHGCGDHLDGAAGQAEAKRPDGVLPSPIVEVLERGGKHTLLAQFTS